MISEPGGRLRMRERFEKSWVVEGPITATQRLSVIRRIRLSGHQQVPISSLAAPMNPAAASNPFP